MSKNQMLIVYSFIMMLVSFNVFALDDDGVKMAENLKLTAEQAKRQDLPLLMFFAAEDCGYCERLENDYLRAMANSQNAKKVVIIRKVVVDSWDSFWDFSGKIVEASDFSDKFDIQVFPTLVFLDHNGDQISHPIIGYNGSYFFGAELDKAISIATNKIRQKPINILKVSNTQF